MMLYCLRDSQVEGEKLFCNLPLTAKDTKLAAMISEKALQLCGYPGAAFAAKLTKQFFLYQSNAEVIASGKLSVPTFEGNESLMTNKGQVKLVKTLLAVSTFLEAAAMTGYAMDLIPKEALGAVIVGNRTVKYLKYALTVAHGKMKSDKYYQLLFDLNFFGNVGKVLSIGNSLRILGRNVIKNISTEEKTNSVEAALVQKPGKKIKATRIDQSYVRDAFMILALIALISTVFLRVCRG